MTDAIRPDRRATGLSHVFWALVYSALLIGVTFFMKHNSVQGPALWAIALLPSLPVAALMWATWRSIRNSDEYLRALQTKRLVCAAGLAMFVATAWGLLQNLGAAPALDPLFAYPAFSFAYGLMCLVVKDAR